jgi:hypothetical protein
MFYFVIKIYFKPLNNIQWIVFMYFGGHLRLGSPTSGGEKISFNNTYFYASYSGIVPTDWYFSPLFSSKGILFLPNTNICI